jgi:hypothetical protein
MIELAHIIETALLAAGAGLANILGQTYQQGMILVKESGVRRQICHKEGLISTVAVAAGSQSDMADDTAGVGINNEYRFVGGIKYYGIGGFFADSVNGKKFLAEAVNILGKQFFQTVMILLTKPLGEGFEFSGFGIVVAAGMDKLSKFGIGYLS